MYNLPNLCSMSHLHFHLPKVSSITFLALCCCLLYASSAGVRGSWTGVSRYGFKGYAWSPSKKPNWGFWLQKSWMLHWPHMNALWAEPGYFTRRLINFIWLSQIPWTLGAWKPFRPTYMSSRCDGALMGINVPSTHPRTLGNLNLSIKPSLIACAFLLSVGNLMICPAMLAKAVDTLWTDLDTLGWLSPKMSPMTCWKEHVT